MVNRLKSAGAVVSNPGARREGGRSFGGFGAKPSPTWESGRPRLLHFEVVDMSGLDGLGLKTIATLFGSAEARIR